MVGRSHGRSGLVRRRQTVCLLTAATLLAACGSQPAATRPSATPSAATTASAPPGTPATSAAPTRCHTPELALTLRGLSPAAGNRFAALVLTNQSPRGCVVYGYPGMQLLDAGLQPLPTDLVRATSPEPRVVHLSSGQSAFSLLHWGAVAAPDENQLGPCQPKATFAEVTPPDETTQLLASWNLDAVCFHGRISVNALVPGTGPSF